MVAPFAGAWIEIPVFRRLVFCWIVAPFAGAWIEILLLCPSSGSFVVAPFAGAWIEIYICLFPDCHATSLPSRERGLKSVSYPYYMLSVVSLPSRERGLKFQPYGEPVTDCRSLPSRERGLKLFVDATHEGLGFVAPFAGAWIEIVLYGIGSTVGICRSLRGSVD